MDEKQVTQDAPSVEQAGQPEKVVESNPVDLQKEVERKEAEIKRLQGITKDLQRRGVSKSEIDALHKEIEGMQETMAVWMDDLTAKVSGEEVTPAKKSYRQQLEEKRAKIKPELDPIAQRFFDYLQEEDLDFDSEFVQEAIKDTKTPQEAIKAVKAKVKEKSSMSMEDIKKQAEAIAKTMVEQELKNRGLTSAGAQSPTAVGGKTFTQKQIRDMSSEEFMAKKQEINEAIRQGRIKD